jgi:GT2 family glycosyltransferase
MKNIAAIVITYNRLHFLKEIVEALRNQTLKPDKIFVIHNSGTDGTAEWLTEQNDLEVITQPNWGSSGGQYTGFKTAFNQGYQWLWTMDDDVVPAPNCLETLLSVKDNNLIRTPLRFSPNGEVFINDCINFNLTSPFKSIWVRIINNEDLKKEFIPAVGITFEGPIIHRSIVEKIGFPEKNFFIYADDSEYFIRANKAGAKIQVFTNAILNRKLDYIEPEKSFSWKHFYIIRNIIAIDRFHGNLPVKYLRPFAYLISWLLKCHNYQDVKTTFRAFIKGYFYKKYEEK